MKRAQMKRDQQNILAVLVDNYSEDLIYYTVFYSSGITRTFKNPSRAFRSRFDWWVIRSNDEYSRILTPRLRSPIPEERGCVI